MQLCVQFYCKCFLFIVVALTVNTPPIDANSFETQRLVLPLVSPTQCWLASTKIPVEQLKNCETQKRQIVCFYNVSFYLSIVTISFPNFSIDLPQLKNIKIDLPQPPIPSLQSLYHSVSKYISYLSNLVISFKRHQGGNWQPSPF